MKNQEYIDLTKKYRCEECGAVYTETTLQRTLRCCSTVESMSRLSITARAVERES